MDVPRIVRTQVTSDEFTPNPELVQSINTGQNKIIEVVQALGPFLTATEDDVRVKGLTYLSNLIGTVDRKQINRAAARTLTNFFLGKLDDFDSLPPSLSGLLVLSKLGVTTFDDDAALDVYRQVVENVNMKAYAQAVRHQVYQLFDSLIAKHRDAFKGMGDEFISSYTNMVDGEKDPRNLMLLFALDRVILTEFNVAARIDDMFDITFCYFPIAFRPPPNDPYGITADDLKIALRNCMSASPHFAKMALPLFLEKYPTSSGPAMKDLLLTIAACLPVYGQAAVSERGEELWECLKTEILYSSDPGIEAASLSALEALLRTVYPSSTDTPSGLAETIIKQCLAAMEEPEKNNAPGSAKALAAMIRASPSTGAYALSQALPQLFRQFNRPTLPSHREPILNFIVTFLLAARSVYATPQSNRKEANERTLEPFRSGLLDVLREGLRTNGLKGQSVKGCVALAEIPGFLGTQEIEDIVQSMDDLLINDTDTEVRPIIMNGLKTIAGVFPDLIRSVTLPILFHTLPDYAPAEADVAVRDKYRNVLDALTELCAMPSLFEALVVSFTAKLDLLSSGSSSTEGAPQENSVAFAWDILFTLQRVIDLKVKAKHVDLPKYFPQVVPRLFGLVMTAALHRSDDVQPLFRDLRLISTVASIAETLFWEMSPEKQEPAFKAAYSAFELGELSQVVYQPSSVASSPGSPLRPGASPAEENLIALYSAMVRGLKTETVAPYPSAHAFLTAKVHWAVRVAKDEFCLRLVLDLICAFVNKRAGQMGDTLAPLLETIWMKDIQDTEQSFEIRRRGLLVYLHITKGLALIRNDVAYKSAERVVDILSLSNLDPQFVDQAAKGFGVLAEAGGKSSKGRGQHLTAKLLYAQKLWSFLLPKIIAGDKDAEPKGRRAYLVAFASLLPLVPPSLCLSDLATVLPLLLRCLSLPDPVQRANVIVTLTSILETTTSSVEADKLLHEHAETMVDGMLASALLRPDQPSAARVRTVALTALGVIPDAIRYETLHPMKNRVLRELGKALDDPLRNVRRQAVDTRARWYSYGK